MTLKKLKDMLGQRRRRETLYSTSEYWDSKARQLEGHAVSMWPNNYLNELYHKEQVELIVNTLPDITNKQLLDLGCGTGRLSRWLALRGARVTGVDFSSEALRIASQETHGDNPKFRQLSMFDLSENEAFDTLISWGSITIATRTPEQLTQLMAKLHSAVKPGGEVLFLEPIHRGFLHRVLDMNVKEFTLTMTKAGFRVHFVQPLHFWPMRLLLCYIPWPKLITSPLYWIGQYLMKIPFFKGMGDYHAIYATRCR